MDCGGRKSSIHPLSLTAYPRHDCGGGGWLEPIPGDIGRKGEGCTLVRFPVHLSADIQQQTFTFAQYKDNLELWIQLTHLWTAGGTRSMQREKCKLHTAPLCCPLQIFTNKKHHQLFKLMNWGRWKFVGGTIQCIQLLRIHVLRLAGLLEEQRRRLFDPLTHSGIWGNLKNINSRGGTDTLLWRRVLQLSAVSIFFY